MESPLSREWEERVQAHLNVIETFLDRVEQQLGFLKGRQGRTSHPVSRGLDSVFTVFPQNVFDFTFSG